MFKRIWPLTLALSACAQERTVDGISVRFETSEPSRVYTLVCQRGQRDPTREEILTGKCPKRV